MAVGLLGVPGRSEEIEVRGRPPGGGGGGARSCDGGGGAVPGTGGGILLALLLDGDAGVELSSRNLGDVGIRGDVGTGGAGAAIGGKGGGARVAGDSSPRGVSMGWIAPGPDSSSSDSEPSDLGALAVGAGGGGGRDSAGTGGGAGRPPGTGGGAPGAPAGTAGGLRVVCSASASSASAGDSSTAAGFSSGLRGMPIPGKAIIIGTGGALRGEVTVCESSLLRFSEDEAFFFGGNEGAAPGSGMPNMPGIPIPPPNLAILARSSSLRRNSLASSSSSSSSSSMSSTCSLASFSPGGFPAVDGREDWRGFSSLSSRSVASS